ncbi:hypothetical protein LRB59_00230 [Borreliella burgdorferi]|uniref:Uncharacterized protein n=3 Tax=Borreliella burgdorferi TaxID=139 RepID=O51420_BORBU|nr:MULTISPECIES: hypothetical protein [Borreliella]AGS66474.1 hypothetical protein L144_02265 [Borreliella burgdorferi CA382]EOA80265.1 hypothetical protein BBUCA8_02277 [Borreliella burgdorferi CA8]AAC66835.1 conserved hypothetical protein [Borreliella burgdorferi B31]ACK74906.1 conserved hypothetical protein [Borreliella burgdorferi ZS7]ADQ29717.1 conserved hypothetical protein [Borreliella burgdorferi N40]
MKILRLCLLFLFFACTFDYDEYSSRSDVAKKFPSIQILGIKYYDVVYNKEQTVLNSLSFSYFNDYKIYKAENGRFLYHSLDNEISGKFNNLEGSYITKDLDMRDSVEFKIEDKNNYYLLNSNRLLWKNKDKKLQSPPNELVLIRFNDSKINGKGFSYFLKSNVFYFDSGVEGIMN